MPFLFAALYPLRCLQILTSSQYPQDMHRQSQMHLPIHTIRREQREIRPLQGLQITLRVLTFVQPTLDMLPALIFLEILTTSESDPSGEDEAHS